MKYNHFNSLRSRLFLSSCILNTVVVSSPLSLGGVDLGVILDWLTGWIVSHQVCFKSKVPVDIYKDIPPVVHQLMMLVRDGIFNGSFGKVLISIFKIIWFTHNKIVYIIPCHIISLIGLEDVCSVIIFNNISVLLWWSYLWKKIIPRSTQFICFLS